VRELRSQTKKKVLLEKLESKIFSKQNVERKKKQNKTKNK
jgi:hypothetical protein